MAIHKNRRLITRRAIGHPVAVSTLLVLILSAISSCATNGPLREAALAWDGTTILPRPAACDLPYATTDGLIWQELNNRNTSVDSRKTLSQNVERIIDQSLNDRSNSVSKCWTVSYENHQHLPNLGPEKTGALGQPPEYDLLVAEFDDQGERTDVSVGHTPFQKSEVALIESRLNQMLAEENNGSRNGGLNIVVFTHGWHGNASADNDYSVWFKAILEQITALEKRSRRTICHTNRVALAETNDPVTRSTISGTLQSRACPAGSADDGRQFAIHRTVGIEITWRGDSENIPYLTWANFQDRESAAQTLARGAVHDLMSRLHKFYLEHSCHGAAATQTAGSRYCDTVHLLTVGHSFGALIDYQSLNGDLATGLLGNSLDRAYGFGDLTVLLNPAFEGEREITLVDAAGTRAAYPDGEAVNQVPGESKGPSWPSKAQMPTVVTLQSTADWATHYAFPFARFFTGFFENRPGAGEYARSLAASGWIRLYKTHALTPGAAGTKDSCVIDATSIAWFCPFDLLNEEVQPNPLALSWASDVSRPPYFPVWTVAVDKSIMRNHDDISNPMIIRFVAQLFRAAYEQSELLDEGHGRIQ